MDKKNEVFYQPTVEDARRALKRQPATKLVTAYFEANKTPLPGAIKVLYTDFLQHLVWHHKSWNPRSKTLPPQIGRMISIHPNQGESFYLCVLSVH